MDDAFPPLPLTPFLSPEKLYSRRVSKWRRSIWCTQEFISLLFLFLDHDLDDLRTFWYDLNLLSFNAVLRATPMPGYWNQTLWLKLLLKRKWVPSNFSDISSVLDRGLVQTDASLFVKSFAEKQRQRELMKTLYRANWKAEWMERVMSQSHWERGLFANVRQSVVYGESIMQHLEDLEWTRSPEPSMDNSVSCTLNSLNATPPRISSDYNSGRKTPTQKTPSEGSPLCFSVHHLKERYVQHRSGAPISRPSRWLFHLFDGGTGVSQGTVLSHTFSDGDPSRGVLSGFAAMRSTDVPQAMTHLVKVGGAFHAHNGIICWGHVGIDRVWLHFGKIQMNDVDHLNEAGINTTNQRIVHLLSASDGHARIERTDQEAGIPLRPFKNVIFSDDGLIAIAQSSRPSRRLIYFYLKDLDTTEEELQESKESLPFDPFEQEPTREHDLEWLWSGAHSLPILAFDVLGCCSSTSSRDSDAIGFPCRLLTIDEGSALCLWRLNPEKIFWLEKRFSVETTLTSCVWLARLQHGFHSKNTLSTMFSRRSSDSDSYRSEHESDRETLEGSQRGSDEEQSLGPAASSFPSDSSSSSIDHRKMSSDLSDFLEGSSIFSDYERPGPVSDTEIIPSPQMSGSDSEDREVHFEFLPQKIDLPVCCNLDVNYLKCPDIYESSHQNPNIFVTGAESGTLALHDARDFDKPIVKLRFHTSPIVSLVVGGPLQDALLSLDRSGTLALWDLKNCEFPVKTYSLPAIPKPTRALATHAPSIVKGETLLNYGTHQVIGALRPPLVPKHLAEPPSAGPGSNPLRSELPYWTEDEGSDEGTGHSTPSSSTRNKEAYPERLAWWETPMRSAPPRIPMSPINEQRRWIERYRHIDVEAGQNYFIITCTAQSRHGLDHINMISGLL